MVASLARRLRVRLGDESGFTIVEAVVGALLLVVGALGVLQLFDAGTRNTYRAEESQVVNNRLQAELEAIKQLPYAQIALTAKPARVADFNDPRWRVSNTRYAIGRDGSALNEMVYNGAPTPGGETVSGGLVPPGPTAFQAGDVRGEIYRFVTWASDPSCPECGAGAMKRIVVAASIDEAPISHERTFQELQTEVVDPEITPDDNPAPPENDPGTATTEFWLADTPCHLSQRQPIVEDPFGSGGHRAHNTRGICSDGLRTGEATPGAPDLMSLNGPAIDDNYPPSEQPVYDYASDSEPAVDATEDIGLAMPWASTDSCTLSPVISTVDVKRLLEGKIRALDQPELPGALDGVLDLPGTDANKHLRVHTWVSPPISGSGGVLLGSGTLDLYTKTVNGAIHPGEVCLWLSVRRPVTIPVESCESGVCEPRGSTTIEVDLPVINVGALASGQCRTGTGLNLPHFSYAQNPWPSRWEDRISIPLCFVAVDSTGAVVPVELPPNSRIALSIMVKRGGTEPGNGLELMYDGVGFESRLEFSTNKILSF